MTIIRGNIKKPVLALLLSLLILTGCEDTNILILTEAGKDAVQAVTLSEEQVEKLAAETVKYSDRNHQVAPGDSTYARRLNRLLDKEYRERDGNTYNYKIYLSGQVNAFALADGSIRIYSGLMDMMNDGELCFVLAHEMGHVVMDHSEKQMRLALAGSALRKVVASQRDIVGSLARSGLVGGLLERLINAQFSQAEEKEADKYALQFLIGQGLDPGSALSALRKLAGSGREITLLSSHPEPEARAEHLAGVLENPEQDNDPGLAKLIWNLFLKVFQLVKALLTSLAASVADLLSSS